jgi:hypothetical protein
MDHTTRSTLGNVMIALGVLSIAMTILAMLIAVERDIEHTVQTIGIVLGSLAVIFLGIRERLDSKCVYLLVRLRFASITLSTIAMLLLVAVFLSDLWN